MSAAKEPSSIRLIYKDPRGSVIPPLYEDDSSFMSDNETDLTKQPIMPKINSPVFKKDDVLDIHVKVEAEDILVLSSSKIRIPVTIRNIRTGVISRTFLKTADFTEYTAGKSFYTTDYDKWCYCTIPAGIELKLGRDYAFNSRVLISPYDDTG